MIKIKQMEKIFIRRLLLNHLMKSSAIGTYVLLMPYLKVNKSQHKQCGLPPTLKSIEKVLRKDN